MNRLPATFVTQMQALLGPDYAQFESALATSAPVSVHHNPHKPAPVFSTAQSVPWYERGAFLAERPSFTLDPYFHAGAYYVQEASSMLVAAAVQRCCPQDRPLRVLDLCAAPGGKSTLLASILPSGSWLLANEVIRSRYQILKYNLAKWGYNNTFTSNHDVDDFAPLAGFFDLVLVDAPCSGEGLFRKDLAARSEWSPDNVKLCAARQGRILRTATHLVAPGGTLLYSTCTYNTAENDANARWLATESGLQHQSLDFPTEWGLEARTYGYQAYPHRLRGEGFYLAAFQQAAGNPMSLRSQPFRKLQPVARKQQVLAHPFVDTPSAYHYYATVDDSWRVLNSALVEDAQTLATYLRRIAVGSPLGTLKGTQLVPAPEWALQLNCAPNIQRYPVDKAAALDILRKQIPPLADLPKGWSLITYDSLGLAWVKGLGNRYNNYYPKQWRIRM